MFVKQIKRIFIIIFILFTVAFTGCAHKKSDPVAAKPDLSPPGLADRFYEYLPPAEGSLWTKTADGLFADKRARRAGDTVIVDIVENTSSEMEAKTNSERTSSIDADITSLMGHNFTRHGNNIGTNMLGGGLTSKFDGKGKSERTGEITASIGARVVEVLPNSNVVIFGKREMKVNDETQYITVTGIARPEDIGNDNRIKSTYLADSRIEYYGKGTIGDKQRAGWLMRIVDNVWPF